MSCSGYNKIVKGDNYEDKFRVAGELFEKKQYMRSVTLYEQIYQRVPRTPEGELAYYRLGKAYYAEKDYHMAGYYFGSFYERFTASSKAEETLFLSALCSVENSPDASLEQNDTESENRLHARPPIYQGGWTHSIISLGVLAKRIPFG